MVASDAMAAVAAASAAAAATAVMSLLTILSHIQISIYLLPFLFSCSYAAVP